jgi:hypothetical protein
VKSLLDAVALSDGSPWNRQKRNEFAIEVDQILDGIGVLAEGNQPNFTPGDSSTAAQRAKEG